MWLINICMRTQTITLKRLKYGVFTHDIGQGSCTLTFSPEFP